MKTHIFEVKRNSLDGLNIQVNETKEYISELGYQVQESFQNSKRLKGKKDKQKYRKKKDITDRG